MTTTLADLKTRIRQRSDNEYTDGKFIDDDELVGLINVSHKHLFGMLVESGLHTVEEIIYTLSPDGSLSYPMPDDCFAVSGVFRLENDYYIPLGRHDQRTFPRDTTETIAWSYRTYGAMENAKIELNPRTSTGTYKIRYCPVPEDLKNDADRMDGVIGWEEWIVLDCAIKILTKEQIFEAVHILRAEKKELALKIEAQAYERDMQKGISVSNVRQNTNNLFDDEGFLPGGYRGVRGYWGSF
jgi:hypothetical protein